MAPQTKGIYIQAAATLLLLVVTVFYTISTNNMANTVKKQFDLTYGQYQVSSRPYVFLEKFQFEPEEYKGLRYVMNMKNSGSVPAKGKIIQLCYDDGKKCNNQDLGYEFFFPNSDGHNIGSVGDAKSIKDYITKNKKMLIIFELNYWALDDVEMKETFFYEIHQELFQDPANPDNILHKNIYVNAN